MNGHGETTIATLAAAAQQKHYRRPQAVVGGEEQQQQLQQKQHYYLSNCNTSSNNSRGKNVLQSGHHQHHHQQHNPALVQQQQHHSHQHRQHQKRQQQHQQYQLLHGNQMQYYHQLPVIVNGQQQQQQQQQHHQNGSGGDGLVRVGGAGGGGGGYASSSTTTSSSPSSSSTAAAAIIVVDPPRPPFIPKKPVLNNGNSAAVDDEHPPRHNNRIYAQANGDCEHGGGAVNGGAAMALFDDCSNGTKITQTTITYIGGAAAAAAAATAGLKRTKSPATVMMATDIEQYNNGGGAADLKNFWNGSELNGKELHNNNENNNNTNSSNRSSFGTDSSFSAGSTVVAADQGLHYSVTGMGTIGAGLANNSTLSSNNTNGMEKPAATNSSSNNNRVQRRLSLVGGISVKLPDYQRPPISSFGCTTGGQGREGRIYATAGFVANENAKKISTLSSSSVIDRSAAATNGIFGLKSAAATSQMCLNGAGSDGKSTLSRRAQKLAQKAAHKLTIGSLSSELSSSASALYSLFTSSAENGAAPNGRSVGTAELGIYAESYLGTSQHFYHDKAPVVSAHTSRGIDFLERFGQFAKERALIEEEYAAKLKSLAKRSRGKKTEDDESKMYTTTMAFLTMLGEIESLASQHEVIGERLRNDLCPQLVEKCRQLRAMRKKQYQDFEMMEKHLQARVDELAKQKKNYEKAHLDAQGAHVKCAKADKNLHLSRIELERAKTNVNTKNAICEQSKQNYAAQLGATNQAKFDHYNVILPQLLEDMRQLDVERIEFSKKAMLDCVASETSVLNIIQRCYSDMNTAIGTINPNRDTLAVVEQTKTGFAHPLDFQFEDLGDPADILLDGTESFDGSTLRRQPGQGKGANGKGGGGVPRKHSLKLFSNSNNGKTNGSAGTHGGGGGGGGGGTCGANTGGEYGTLPPQQRCRKIQQKLEELEAELNIKDQSQAGMQRMHVAYTQNPQLGDPAKVAEQLLQNQQEMHTLQTQIQRFKELLQSAQGELNQPLGGNPHQHQAAQQQMHATTTTTTSSSSPGSSPRGSIANVAGKLKNGQQHHNGGRLNGGGPPPMGSAEQQHRASSYSEASSISSADGSMMMLSASFNGGPGASGTAARTTSGTIYPQLPPMSAHPPQQHQQMNGGINGVGTAGAVLHQSASGTTLSSSGAATAAAAGSAPAPPCQQHVPYVDTGSGDFYEECDTPAAAAANGCPVPQQQSDVVLGTAIAMYAYDAAPDEVGGTTISMRDGDELLLLERDVGDGWTRVRHMQSNAEGFVPSSYLECKWYSTDA